MYRKVNRLLGLVLAFAVTAGCFAAGGAVGANAAGSGGGGETDALEQTGALAEAAASVMLPAPGGETGKEETVYVIADASGQPAQTIVSAWLKNSEGAAVITDKADLKNIRNAKGDETFTTDGEGNQVWAAGGNDIYYQGDASQPLPITVHVDYTLDGESVSPEELAGASGHLVMTFTYENDTKTTKMVDGEPVEMYQPFVAISCAVLDSEKAANVSVTNGKLVNLGEQLIVAGLAMPGLKESLGLDELAGADGGPVEVDIPEEVVVSADVTDFSLLTTLTIVENTLLNDIDLENVDSFDELEGSMDELTDASGQLTEGSGELYDGAEALAAGAGDLSAGAAELSDGANTVAYNMGQLYNGLATLKTGAGDLSEGLDTLNGQVAGLPESTAALKAGAAAVKTALEQQVKPGADALQTGAQAVSDTLRNEVKPGAAGIQAGADSIAAGAAGIQTAADSIAAGAGNIAAGAQTMQTELKALPSQANDAVLVLDGVGVGLDNAAGTLAALEEGLEPAQVEALEGVIGLLTQCKGRLTMVSGGMTALAGSLDPSSADSALNQIIAGANAIAAGAKSGDPANPGIYEAAGAISAGAKSGVAEQPGIYEAAGALASGAETLAAEGSDALAAGAGQLSAGVDAIVSGNDGSNLNALIDGLGTLNDGSQPLAEGVGKLAEGADTLEQGLGTAVAGAAQLSAGTSTLASGSQAVKSGAQELSDGVGQVVTGAYELKEGMSQFDSEGIRALSELVKGDARGFFDRLRALQEYAGEYTSFSGKADGTVSTVRFVIRTDSIEKK